MKSIVDGNYHVEIELHLLIRPILTKNRCEKYNYRPKAEIAGPQVRFLPWTYSCIYRSCFWLGLKNGCKFPLDIFHLQDSSTIVQSTEMRTKPLYRKQHGNLF